jgi:RimJ/RimL family protein N-acetyltransferase
MSPAEIINGYAATLQNIYGRGSLSDCFARCPDTSVEATEQVIVYKTKTRPDFWFGNYIVSSSPVTSESLPDMRSQWLKEFSQEAGILWQIVEWEIPFDGEMPDVSKVAIALNAEIDIRIVRIARRGEFQFQLSRTELTADIELIKVKNEVQYEKTLKIALADHEETPQSGATSDFIQWRLEQRRQSANLGNGNWWLLMHQEVPVASCGLFFDQYGLKGRFREVTTHPKWRGRGFATKLCGMLAQKFLKQGQVQELIIVSEPDSIADRVYSKLGFKAVSYQIALITDPRSSQID